MVTYLVKMVPVFVELCRIKADLNFGVTSIAKWRHRGREGERAGTCSQPWRWWRRRSGIRRWRRSARWAGRRRSCWWRAGRRRAAAEDRRRGTPRTWPRSAAARPSTRWLPARTGSDTASTTRTTQPSIPPHCACTVGLAYRALLHRAPKYIGRSDVTESMVTVRSPFCGYNTT